MSKSPDCKSRCVNWPPSLPDAVLEIVLFQDSGCELLSRSSRGVDRSGIGFSEDRKLSSKLDGWRAWEIWACEEGCVGRVGTIPDFVLVKVACYSPPPAPSPLIFSKPLRFRLTLDCRSHSVRKSEEGAKGRELLALQE